MGVVYEALDQRLNCIVALKETIAGNNDEGRRAFEREASLLGNLRHPAMPKVMDYFSEAGRDYLVMEFIPGHDLAELLEIRGGPFPESEVLRWADELLRVLEYLHGQKPPILHRDIKPSNLKLTKQGEIFLIDFGLAKGSAGQMPTLVTNRSVRGFTAVYASLEQIHGDGTDPRSDLYSLGATLYQLLTGVPPIAAPTRFNAIEDERPDPLPPIEALNSNTSAGVARAIHQSMAISRRQRPSSATEMLKILSAAAATDSGESAKDQRQREEAETVVINQVGDSPSPERLSEGLLVSGILRIDRTRHEVRVGDALVELTRTEFDLLYLLASNPGRVFTRNDLVKTIRKDSYAGDARMIDSHINRLRNKIEENPEEPRFVLTVWGVGYKFSESQ